MKRHEERVDHAIDKGMALDLWSRLEGQGLGRSRGDEGCAWGQGWGNEGGGWKEGEGT